MRERLVDNSYPNPERLRAEYDFGVGYALRWLFYEYVEDGRDFHSEAVRILGLKGDENILDVGCGQGAFLKSVDQQGHSGTLVGLDYSNTFEYVSQNTPVRFVAADASCFVSGDKCAALPFADSSFDVTTALFMLYHVDSPESTLRDMTRITRPDGKIIVATSAQNNKQQHRRFEALLAKDMGVEKPPRYTRTFTTEIAENLLPRLFNQVETAIDHDTQVILTEADMHQDPFFSEGKLSTYIASLKSMVQQYGHTDEERIRASIKINDSIKRIVLPEMCRQIKESGQFVETIHRKLYICSNAQ